MHIWKVSDNFLPNFHCSPHDVSDDEVLRQFQKCHSIVEWSAATVWNFAKKQHFSGIFHLNPYWNSFLNSQLTHPSSKRSPQCCAKGRKVCVFSVHGELVNWRGKRWRTNKIFPLILCASGSCWCRKWIKTSMETLCSMSRYDLLFLTGWNSRREGILSPEDDNHLDGGHFLWCFSSSHWNFLFISSSGPRTHWQRGLSVPERAPRGCIVSKVAAGESSTLSNLFTRKTKWALSGHTYLPATSPRKTLDFPPLALSVYASPAEQFGLSVTHSTDIKNFVWRSLKTLPWSPAYLHFSQFL